MNLLGSAAPHLSLHRQDGIFCGPFGQWSSMGDSDSRPAGYKAAALPTELMERDCDFAAFSRTHQFCEPAAEMSRSPQACRDIWPNTVSADTTASSAGDSLSKQDTYHRRSQGIYLCSHSRDSDRQNSFCCMDTSRFLLNRTGDRHRSRRILSDNSCRSR